MTPLLTALHCRIPYTLIYCRDYKNRVLFVRRFKPPFVGLWNLPGGKIDVSEVPMESACRELREEAGIGTSLGSMRFCGLALWPTGRGHELAGMFLFRTSVRGSSRDYRQMSINDEGVFQWVDLTSEAGCIDLVPNFSTLVFAFLEPRPQGVLHWENAAGGYDFKRFGLSKSGLTLSSRVWNDSKVSLFDIVDPGDQRSVEEAISSCVAFGASN